MEAGTPFDPRSLLKLVERIKLQRAGVLPRPDAFEAICNSARLIAIHAPNGVVAILAREVEVTARDFYFRRHVEPPAILQARLDDRLERLEATVRTLL
jgi:hypothetical protein